MGMKAKDLRVRVGAQADRTTVAASFIDLAIPADGDQLVGNTETTDLDTDHGARGVLYTSKDAKNDAEQGFQSYAFPVAMGTLMGNLFDRDASGDQGYLSVEAWWGDAIASGQVKGSRRLGVVLNQLSMQIDKTGRGQSVILDFQGWINDRRNIATGESTPTATFSPLLPWSTTGALIDFVADVSIGSFGGANADVRRVSLSYNNNGEVEQFESNSVAPTKDTSWTVHTPGEETLEVEVAVALNDEEYVELDQALELPSGGIRVLFTHPSSAQTTTSTAVPSGDSGDIALTVADETGFDVGDVVAIFDSSLNFVAAKVSAVATNEITIDTAEYSPRVSLTGTLTLANMAGIITVDSMKFVDQGAPVRDGNKRIVTLQYRAQLASGASSILSHAFYDHLTSHS